MWSDQQGAKDGYQQQTARHPHRPHQTQQRRHQGLRGREPRPASSAIRQGSEGTQSGRRRRQWQEKIRALSVRCIEGRARAARRRESRHHALRPIAMRPLARRIALSFCRYGVAMPIQPKVLFPICLAVVAPAYAQHGIDAGDINKNGAACTDFFDYANGAWRSGHSIPDYMDRWSRRWESGEINKEHVRDILSDESKKTAWPKGSAEQLSGDFYAACMDEN